MNFQHKQKQCCPSEILKLVNQDSRSLATSTPKGNSKFEILLVKILSLKKIKYF